MTTRQDVDKKPSTSYNVFLDQVDVYAQKLRRGTPNALTLGNLTCGLFSLILAINGLHRFSAIFIFIAAAFDLFDGRVARALGITSDIGAQLDSLADVVSFGVAPAILAHTIQNWSFLMVIAFVSFPLAGAWRLARFNVHPTQGHFVGLPIPAAGLAVAFLAFFSYVSPLIMIGLALFMISRIEVPKL
ncbi:unnamed protein product [Adineta steineri]|uniref:CDP-diacylglycerol--serine O-phosphatidyltransferase n=1 Tax=Adineta steineri TaxID=433720 RepID=A0A813N5J5_9BILA|nr:unnamed protein product [Adineta steineri]CAF0732161.1 unnamed protein product [Adineta steineri]CAF0764697.1 unnamed protein product [Adineta steineri]CAF3769127.1 unnamed protein product [Adineta steineri]CAF3791738.1 unnamed protein product [Adineta steineri]